MKVWFNSFKNVIQIISLADLGHADTDTGS